jgi:hypothetical protein
MNHIFIITTHTKDHWLDAASRFVFQQKREPLRVSQCILYTIFASGSTLPSSFSGREGPRAPQSRPVACAGDRHVGESVRDARGQCAAHSGVQGTQSQSLYALALTLTLIFSRFRRNQHAQTNNLSLQQIQVDFSQKFLFFKKHTGLSIPRTSTFLCALHLNPRACIFPRSSFSFAQGDSRDDALFQLMPFLEHMAKDDVTDVREVLRSYKDAPNGVAQEFYRRTQVWHADAHCHCFAASDTAHCHRVGSRTPHCLAVLSL